MSRLLEPPTVSRAAPELTSQALRGGLAIAQHAAVLGVSLLVASFVIYLALYYLPGDPAAILAGTDATPAQTARIRAELGLDRPVLFQYADWIGGAVTGDLGVSLLDRRSVAEQLGEKLQVTLPLCIAALMLSVAIALPLGMVAGARHATWYGSLIGSVTQFGVALPTFVVGLALVSVISVQLRILPAQGFPADRWDEPADAVRALILPTITLAIPLSAGLIRFVRSATMDLVSQDWLRTARAQGWSRPAALVRQGLRNASLPLVSVIGLELAGLLMGSVIVERVFTLPGIGQMILQDVGNRDINKVQGTLLVLTAIIMATTLLLNLSYTLIDPRLKVRR